MAPHQRTDAVERGVEEYYGKHPWLNAAQKERVRAAVQEYADTKLAAAQSESERAGRRLEALKQEQQHLVQLSYKGLVDDEVLAAEQARIRGERALVEKWATTAGRDKVEISEALEEALALLDNTAAAYWRASAITRRMFNQALFQRLLILDDEVVVTVEAPWVEAMVQVAERASPEATLGSRTWSRAGPSGIRRRPEIG